MHRKPLATVVLLVALTAPSAAKAQARYGRSADEGCDTGPIASVFIDNHSIFNVGDPELNPHFQWAYRLANRLHFRTRRNVVRRELLFQPGDCFDPVLATESERLLRELAFLSRVDVFGIRQDDGTYHVVVDTQDEWSTQVGMNVRANGGIEFRGADIREQNIAGNGQTARLYYLQHRVSREYGATFFTPQFAATRWDLSVGVGRTRAGSFVDADVAYPFVGEVGRWSAEQRFSRRDEYFDFVAESSPSLDTHVLIPVRNQLFDLALLRRIGNARNLTLLGGGFTFRNLSYPGGYDGIRIARQRDFDRLQPGDSALVVPAWQGLQELREIRANLIFGQRNIWWVKRRGLDSPRGVQDVRLGAEAQVSLGRSLPAVQHEDDLFGQVSLYTGMELGPVLTALRLQLDGRRDFQAPPGAHEWADLYGHGEMVGYWKPAGSTHQTLFARLAGLGGWFPRTPFQLTLGGEEAVRGYDQYRFPGARRLVLTLEDRTYFGWPFPDVFDLGATVFVDAGRVWAGSAPFGVSSGWRSSGGIGLRGAFPAGGRTTYRLDLAVPLDAGEPRRPRLLISVGEAFGITVPFSTRQLERSRPSGMFGDVFSVRR